MRASPAGGSTGVRAAQTPAPLVARPPPLFIMVAARRRGRVARLQRLVNDQPEIETWSEQRSRGLLSRAVKASLVARLDSFLGPATARRHLGWTLPDRRIMIIRQAPATIRLRRSSHKGPCVQSSAQRCRPLRLDFGDRGSGRDVVSSSPIVCSSWSWPRSRIEVDGSFAERDVELTGRLGGPVGGTMSDSVAMGVAWP